MDENYKGELRLADGTPIGKVADWYFGHEHFDPPKYDFREMFKSIEGKIEGTFIPGDGLNAFIDSVFRDYQDSEVLVYVSQKTLWILQYLAQGKHYPSPKKRKNKSRMSKKWRNKA
jgi:hypothetical protein